MDEQKFTTQPIPIQAGEPSETEDLKLRMGLSKPTCYVGDGRRCWVPASAVGMVGR